MSRLKIRYFAIPIAFLLFITLLKLLFMTSDEDEFIVYGDSMLPTFSDGDVVTVKSINYHNYKFEYDDIIVFNHTVDNKNFKKSIKRVVGISGDEIIIERNNVYLNNNLISKSDDFIDDYYIEYVKYDLSNDELFVVGDNKKVSYDSRYYGPIKKSTILGVVDVEE